MDLTSRVGSLILTLVAFAVRIKYLRQRGGILKTIGVTLLIWVLAGSVGAKSIDNADRVSASREVAASFMAALKTELLKAMKEGGPVHAISVCRDKAPEIAAAKTKETGFKVGRTGLRVRNLKNSPDAWEKNVMAAFESRKAEGEDVRQLEHWDVVSGNGTRVFRYMKAIPTGGLCLRCHGVKLHSSVENTLKSLYPQDRATGFTTGDIRGAFTISQTM